MRSFVEVIEILKRKLELTNRQIISNGFLLHACPENIKRIIEEIPRISEVSIKEILQKKPKIAMQRVECIKRIIQHVHSFNIADEAIVNCLDVLSLSSNTVYERLAEFSKVQEFDVLRNHRRCLRLVVYQNKAKLRLDYLKQHKHQCASLSVLTAPSVYFEKYISNGGDKTGDTVEYLSNVFKLDPEAIRSTLNKHPHWRHIPIITVKKSIELLQDKNFTDNEISENLHLLLYPLSRTKPGLELMLHKKSIGYKVNGIDYSLLTNNQLLRLCLYFIESEFNLSGNGVWEPNQSENEQDSTPATTPRPTQFAAYVKNKIELSEKNYAIMKLKF